MLFLFSKQGFFQTDIINSVFIHNKASIHSLGLDLHLKSKKSYSKSTDQNTVYKILPIDGISTVFGYCSATCFHFIHEESNSTRIRTTHNLHQEH